MKRLVCLQGLLALCLLGSAAVAGGLIGPHPHGGSGTSTPQSISSVTLGGGNSFVAGSPDGTQVGPISAVMSPPTPLCNCTFAVNNSNFRVVGSNLVTNGVQSAPSYTGVIITAHSSNPLIADKDSAPITITTPGQRIADITISAASFAAAAPSGTVVGQFSVAMLPSSPGFAGTFPPLSGTGAGNFAISGSNLVTNGVLCAGTPPCSYDITVTAQPSAQIFPFSKNFTITAVAGPSGIVTVFLTASPGSLQSWSVPANWPNGNNTIEAIGGGPGGGTSNGGNDAGGGSGGCYSKISNLTLTPSGTASYQIGVGGAPGVAGGDTWFNGASLGASSAGAKGGVSTTNALGGIACSTSAGVGTVKFAGGAGGASNNSQSGGAGGGAAAGPGGQGQAGGPSASNGGSGGGGAGGGLSTAGNDGGLDGGIGGAGPDGTAGGGAGQSGSHGSGGGGGQAGIGPGGGTGGAGGDGIDFNAGKGAGGGGGGGGYPSGSGGDGGCYGGAGGGSAFVAPSGGSGCQGIIKITYGGTAPAQSIVSVGMSSTSFAGGSADGTVVGTIVVGMNPSTPLFAGAATPYVIGGVNASLFRLSGANVVTNGIVAAGNYSITLTANPSAGSIAAFTSSPIAITATGAAPQVIASISLDNAQFQGGAGSAGALVGHLSVTMSSPAPAFSGSQTLDNGNFTIANCAASVCELRVGTSNLPGNTNYAVNVTATPSNGSIQSKTLPFTISATGAPGSAITTFTFQNQTGATLPSGSAVRFGQSFRRGDVLPGDCVKPRNAGTHADLSYDLFEIATRRENNDDGSIRHLVWWARADSAVLNGGTYTVEFVKTGAACSAQTPRSPAAMKARLVAASHALKLVLTDVRNQDGSLRGVSGHNTLTGDINSAFDNTGRDAPRSCGAGDVDDCWVLSIQFKNDQGVVDPMLYMNYYLDATSNADGTLGKIVHSGILHNGWMNVAAGSAGNSGAPGPVGLANDPQAISYRPQLFDGATNQLDWSWWDQSVASASNPVRLGGAAGGCANGFRYRSNGNWTFPNSTGDNALTHGMALWYHTAGTPPTGMPPSGSMVFVYGSGIESGRVNGLPDTTDVGLVKTQFNCFGLGTTGSYDASNQGSGTQLFDFRVWHFHPSAWVTVDQNAADNVTAADGTRTPYSLYPALTSTEQTYWRQTGTIAPTRLTNGLANATAWGQDIAVDVYSPTNLGNSHLGNAGGIHNNLAQVNEFMSQAFLGETKDFWDSAAIQSAAVYGASWMSILNERTGRIPAANNGAPGLNHAGAGASYSELGAPFGNIGFGVSAAASDVGTSNIYGMVPGLTDVPFSISGQGFYRGGVKGWGRQDGSHWGSYHNGLYQILGQRRVLDTIYLTANRSVIVVGPGNAIETQTPVINGVKYFSSVNYTQEGRGAINLYREFTLGAALGGDSNIERTYFKHIIDENYWVQIASDAFIDGLSANFRSLFTSPWQATVTDPYMDSYGGQMAFQGWAMLRDPLSKYFLDHYVVMYSSACADAPGDISSKFCANFQNVSNVRDFSFGAPNYISPTQYQPNLGQYFVNDASERGIVATYWNFAADGSGNVCVHPNGVNYNLMQDGDKVKNMPWGGSPAPDELHLDTWYSVTQTDNSEVGTSTKCMKIINPATGTPFTSWTIGGSPYSSTRDGYIKLRPTRTTPGWAGSYATYVQTMLSALRAVGYSAIQPAIDTMKARSIQDGWATGYVLPGSDDTRDNWEPNLVVP